MCIGIRTLQPPSQIAQMNYTHLTREERYQIHSLLKAGHSQSQVAQFLLRHPSTICREIARNSTNQRYCPRRAGELARERAQACANGPRIDDSSWEFALDALREGWSPEEVTGVLKLHKRPGISHETIYRRIYVDKGSGGSIWRHLRCRKARRKRYGDRRGRQRPVGATPIEMRPAIVETRSTFGHWEGDTMLDTQLRGALVTLVERKSRYTLAAKVAQKSSGLVKRAVNRLLAPFKPLVDTLTLDNGKEFSKHAELNVTCYFARPYASWQRGTVENTNGLLRQYFPRSRKLSSVRCKDVQFAMDKLNHRPRKCLGFRTPHEVFMQALASVALQG